MPTLGCEHLLRKDTYTLRETDVFLTLHCQTKSTVEHTDPQNHPQPWGFWADRTELKAT